MNSYSLLLNFSRLIRLIDGSFTTANHDHNIMVGETLSLFMEKDALFMEKLLESSIWHKNVSKKKRRYLQSVRNHKHDFLWRSGSI